MKFYKKIKPKDTIDFKRLNDKDEMSEKYTNTLVKILNKRWDLDANDECALKRILKKTEKLTKADSLYVKAVIYNRQFSITKRKEDLIVGYEFLEQLIEIKPIEKVNYIYFNRENGVFDDIVDNTALNYIYKTSMLHGFKHTFRPNFLEGYFFFKYLNKEEIDLESFEAEVNAYSQYWYPMIYMSLIQQFIRHGKINKGMRLLKKISKVKYLGYYNDLLDIADFLEFYTIDNKKKKYNKIINNILKVCEKNIPHETEAFFNNKEI